MYRAEDLLTERLALTQTATSAASFCAVGIDFSISAHVAGTHKLPMLDRGDHKITAQGVGQLGSDGDHEALGIDDRALAVVGLGSTAAAAGQGLFTGAAGTAAMTVSSTHEAKLRERRSSSAPADAAGKLLGVQPRNEAGEARFSNIVHWAYGTSWGAVRGLHAAGGDGPRAASVRFAAVWGSAQAMLPALDVAPAPWDPEPREIAIDAFHHARLRSIHRAGLRRTAGSFNVSAGGCASRLAVHRAPRSTRTD